MDEKLMKVILGAFIFFALIGSIISLAISAASTVGIGSLAGVAAMIAAGVILVVVVFIYVLYKMGSGKK